MPDARMRSRSIAAWLAATSLLVASRARADEPPVSIVVTGSAATSFSVTAKEGDRPRDTPDAASLLEGLPGLRVRRLGVEGGFATVSIRGAASNQVAVSLAGVPLTGAADPSLDLATLPLWPGSTVHAFRTFAPAGLGGGYLGGLVAIDPIAPDAGKGTKARTELYDAIGAFGALRMRIADVRSFGSSGVDGGRWRLATGLSASRIEGTFPYLDPTLGPGREVDRSRENAGNAQLAAIVQARRDVDAWTIILTALGQTRRDGVAGTFLRPTTATRLFRERELFAIEGRRGDDDGRFLVRAWLRHEHARFEDALGEQGPRLAGAAHDDVYASGVLLGRSIRFGDRLTLDARVDQQLETAVGVRVLGPTPDRKRVRFGLSVDATWRATELLTLLAAARADLRRDIPQAGETTTEMLPAAHLGAEHALGDDVTLAAHFGFLARPPSFLELLGDGGATEPAPGLSSERAVAGDLGLRARGVLGALRWDGELVGFASRTRDLIVLTPRGLGTLRAENVGAAAAGGLEASLGLLLGPMRLVTSYTFLSTRDLTSIAASSGQPLPGRPKHDLTVDLSAKIAFVTVRYGLDVVSSTALDRQSTVTLPTRSWHSIGANAEVSRGVFVLGEIANLFDQRSGEVVYESSPIVRTVRYPHGDFIGYPIPGRRWTIALRIQL
jgi:vitamin B12 transporter